MIINFDVIKPFYINVSYDTYGIKNTISKNEVK